jgi:hypothetical protein
LKPTLSVDQLKDAFESLDWTKVEPLLTDAGGTNADSGVISRALQRANGLLFKYPATALEQRRESLFASLAAYLTPGHADSAPPQDVLDAIETLKIAESGYRQLVKALAKTEASKLDPALHVAAAILRAEREADQILATLHEQLQNQQVVTMHLQIRDEDGNTLDPDAGLEHCVTFAGMTIQMEAFKSNWFDADGNIVIPVAPSVTEEAIYQAGSTFLLATLWKRWQSTEEGARLLGTNLKYVGKEEWPTDAPAGLKKVVQFDGVPALELLHRVAAERMHDKLTQNHLEMWSDSSSQQVYRKASKYPHLLPPHGLILYDELHANTAIRDILAYDIFSDQEQPGGLRLVEWVRGYSALKKVVDEDGSSCIIVRSRADWLDFFSGYGLSTDVAGCLIDRLTFRRSSRDLFDHPFIKHKDGSYQLFKTAFYSMNIAAVVMSAIGNLGEQLQKKGKSFEVAVRKMFAQVELKTYTFKETRNGEEYEYDVLLPWGDYLFVFECKNRSLPNGNPIQMHYFDLENLSNIRQIKRLMQALDDYPDILMKHLPPGAATKMRVPVILNCLPYSIPQGFDGVYFYDYSALARFFKNAQVFAHDLSGGEIIATVKWPDHRLWKCDAPSPEDFLVQLNESLQFKIVRESLELDNNSFPLPPDWYVLSSGFRRSLHPAVNDMLSGQWDAGENTDSIVQ